MPIVGALHSPRPLLTISPEQQRLEGMGEENQGQEMPSRGGEGIWRTQLHPPIPYRPGSLPTRVGQVRPFPDSPFHCMSPQRHLIPPSAFP